MSFQGFSPGLPAFLAQLREHNSREWFQAHRGEYEAVLLGPAREFVGAMAEPLKARFGADVHAEPKVHGSILASIEISAFRQTRRPTKRTLTCGSGKVMGQDRIESGQGISFVWSPNR